MSKRKFTRLLRKAFTRQMTSLNIAPNQQSKYVKEWVPHLWENIPKPIRIAGNVAEIFKYVPPLSLCMLLLSFPGAMALHLQAVRADISAA